MRVRESEVESEEVEAKRGGKFVGEVLGKGMQAGVTISSGDYSPYGKVLREYINGDQERYLTTQHERDESTGLDYRGARYYDSDIARFLSLDPLARKYPSLSDYNYVLGNPIIFIDPNGKTALSYSENDLNRQFTDALEKNGNEYELGTNKGGWTKNHLLMNRAFGDASGFNSLILPSVLTRPSWDDVYNNYPKDPSDATKDLKATEVFIDLFGDEYDESNYCLQGGTPGNLYNACTARLSTALALSGVNLRMKDYNGLIGSMKGKGIIIRSSKMKTYLENPSVFGPADISFDGSGMNDADLASRLQNKTGIYILIAHDPKAFRASGHCTLWTGSSVIGHSYIHAGTVFFWELK